MKQVLILALFVLVGVTVTGCASEVSDGDKKTTATKFEDMNKNAKPGDIQR